MARNLVRFDPFAELDRLQRDFFEDGMLASRRTKLPTTDIYTKDDKELIVEVHLPDFDENDISVNIDEGALVIQAEKHEKEEDKDKKYVVRESSQSFYRRIALPQQSDQAKIAATFDKGVLRVDVPFAALPAPTKIPITAGTKA
ncbi:Hsp20/alpha crystallin family protein [Leifsonia soli]|uniref:HSP20 family protein n=1 Tax=Leifsonia soli TaxID=582665 RepID=A0A852SYH1_9MICO|nr:Hsp20/alpha crystallin family protein [Leifsonia soli]NYD73721.1 HSP20 family protein [Leifsonia soli]